MAERSKARGSGPRLARGVGSNPTVVNFFSRFSYLSPFFPFPAGLSPIPAAFFLAFQNFTLLERAYSRPVRGLQRDEGVPVLHTLLLLSRCAQGPSQVQHQPAGTGPQTEGASKGNFATCSQD